jgi:hypothetical protein
MQFDDTVQVPLRARNGAIVGHTLIDADDADFVNQWAWGRYNGYARRRGKMNGKHTTICLHRELMGLSAGDGFEIDHVNRDKLDNRRSNLRVVTHGQQMQNRSSHRGSASQYRGVSFKATTGKWIAQAKIRGKNHHLGYYATEDEAAAVAKKARARLLPYAVD